MSDPALVLVILAGALVLFATEMVRLDVVGLGIMVLLVATGLLPPESAFRGFANPALLTVAAMFVLSAGLNRTGALAFVADRIIHFSRGGQKRLLLLLMLTAAVMSAFINNTTVVVIFIPLVISIAQEFGTSPSRLLMPLSFASIFGGTCTLIGTSTNLLVAGLAQEAGMAPIRLFELAPMGLVFVVVGTVYLMTVGRRLLPDRRPVSLPLGGETRREYLTEVQVRKGSAMVGQTVAGSILAQHPDLAVLQIVRGEQIIWPPLDKVLIQAEDVLMIRGPVETLVSVQSQGKLEVLPELARGQIRFDPKAAMLAEVVILPNSPLVGVRVGDARFRRLYGVTVMALQRRGAHFREKVTQMDLRPGDILLIYGDEGAVENLKAADEFILLEQPRPVQSQSRLAVRAILVMAGVVGLVATGVASLLTASMAGALVLILAGCLRPQDAYAAIDFRLLVLIAGALALGTAIDATGTAELLAAQVTGVAGRFGPLAVLAAVYLLTMLTTEMLSNNAAAVIIFPVAVSAAHTLGVDPRPFVMAVTFAASASFSTPIGYQTNTLVYGAGGYRFIDFARVGVPLNLLFWGLATVGIPLIWSF